MHLFSPRWRQTATTFALVAIAVLAADGFLHAVMAQVTPFGGPRPPADPQPYQASGLIGWILTKQSEFYRAMSSTIRAAKTDGSAVVTLLGISFAYGVFHAAGPGHGKAVISSYMLANEETAKRGIVLSFLSALLQSLVAVLIVTIGALILGATARTLCSTERGIEIVSYGLIAALGAWLVFTKGRGLIRSFGASPAAAHAHGHDHAHHDHGHHHHAHDHHSHAHHDHAHAHNPAHGEPGHVHDEHCGHNHGPDPSQLAGPGGWARGLGAIFAVGLRPCSGAILVLVFALAQGLFWAGVAATFVMGLGTALTVATIAVIAVSAKGLARRLTANRDGKGALLLKGIEFCAAVAVLFLGTGLLLGYLAAERTVCF